MAEVIVFHHAQGLTPGVRQFADDLAAAGHRVRVPDLYDGRTFPTIAEGVAHARTIGFETIVDRARKAVEGLPGALVYVGCSLGVMPAQMLAQTRKGAKGAVLLHACLPHSEFGDGSWPAGVRVQVHAMDRDPYFMDEEDVIAARELVAKVRGAQLFLYPGDQHLFTDSSLPAYDMQASRLVVQRVLAFLALLSRDEPEPAGQDLVLLERFLDLQRQTMLAKTAGLDKDGMARRIPNSSLSLGGLLYHLALVEESWMEERFAGGTLRQPWSEVDFDSDPEWEFRTSVEVDPDALRLRYQQACQRSRQVVASASGPDQLSALPLRDGRPFSLRWVLLNLIEETARHLGHADLLREAIDGSIGE